MSPFPIDVAAVAAGTLAAKLWLDRRRGRATNRRSVAVFDAQLPPGLAFIRSLGAAGIPVTTYSHEQRPPGRYSRYTNEFRRSPDPIDADAFIDWLVDEMTSGEVDLVAPTSDYVVFNTTQALERIGGSARGYAPAGRVNDCLFKGHFATAIEAAGFPTPPTRMPTSFDEAIADATYLGYPLVLKPRSHVGVGVARGVVVRSEAELVRAFVPHALGEGHRSALAIDPQLRFPLLQQYRDPSRVDVISVSGALDLDGALLALGHSRKTHQWPPRLGIGTRFEAIGPQPFTEQAIAAVRTVLGHGVFELEVLVDRVTGEYWAIDLNPRGFGQMSLDIAAGRDLPVLWYNSAADIPVASARRAPGPPPKYWSMGFHYYADAYTRRWPGRASCGDAPEEAGDGPNVGPMWQSRDPIPAAVWAWQVVRHPLGLVRPYFNNSELVAGHDEDPSVV